MLQVWLAEMSTYVRQLDPNHMITVGSEGFFGPSTPLLLQYNPGPWAADVGQVSGRGGSGMRACVQGAHRACTCSMHLPYMCVCT